MKKIKDLRNKFWSILEKDIQSRGKKKDKGFSLAGTWKQFFQKNGTFRVFIVDGEWVRNNLSVIFGHGGHGLVHEFIPLDEIWIGKEHFDGCACKKISKTQALSPQAIQSTMLHEIVEYKAMKKGILYGEAHNQALVAERKANHLVDPYDDRPQKNNQK